MLKVCGFSLPNNARRLLQEVEDTGGPILHGNEEIAADFQQLHDATLVYNIDGEWNLSFIGMIVLGEIEKLAARRQRHVRATKKKFVDRNWKSPTCLRT
jgi:predicted transcriptional regulator